MGIERFSYSKIGVFEQCRYKYKLIYTDGHYISTDSVATEFGTLVHYIEEQMVKRLNTNFTLTETDYQELLDLFEYADIHNPTETVLGLTILRDKYKDEWNVPDKSNRTYEEKADEYKVKGIYRLREFLRNNPEVEVLDAEKEFNLDFQGYLFHGFIDRVYRNTSTGEIYVEDIKTWSQEAGSSELTTPMQFVIYCLAAEQIYNVTDNQLKCFYELPLCNIKQAAGTKGFISRGVKKLSKLLAEIETGDFTPNPSPLCHWCVFSGTYPNQPEEAKKLCPYFSHWTKLKKDFTVENEFLGPDQHDKILEAFQNDYKKAKPKAIIEVVDSARRFIIRR